MNRLLCLIVCVITYQLLYSMEDHAYSVEKEVIIANADVDTGRILAVLNKSYNQFIENKYRPDKKRIEFLLKEQNIKPGFLAWNYDFSQCAWFNERGQCHQEGMRSCIEFTLVSLNIIKELNIRTNCRSKNIFCVVPDMRRPYFDKQGLACLRFFYSDNLYQETRIQECSLNTSGIVGNKTCFFTFFYNNKEYIQTFSHIIHLPFLLQAILSSMTVGNQNVKDNEKFYAIEKLIVPDKYKQVQQSPFRCNYRTYDALPELLKNYFDDVREKQQNTKKLDVGNVVV